MGWDLNTRREEELLLMLSPPLFNEREGIEGKPAVLEEEDVPRNRCTLSSLGDLLLCLMINNDCEASICWLLKVIARYDREKEPLYSAIVVVVVVILFVWNNE